MNPDLQKARQHYDTLPPHVKERATAKHMCHEAVWRMTKPGAEQELAALE